MSEPTVSGRPEGEPRLDVHNSNVDEDAAETGRCGTLDLRSGRVCRLPALHHGACDFQAPGRSGRGEDGGAPAGRQAATGRAEI